MQILDDDHACTSNADNILYIKAGSRSCGDMYSYICVIQGERGLCFRYNDVGRY